MALQISAAISDVWDRALGVFDKAVDFEFGKNELQLQADIQLFKSAQAFEEVQRQALFNETLGNGFLSGVSNSTLLIVAGLGIAGLLLLNR